MHLKIDKLSIHTLKGRSLLKDFSFVLNENDKIALIGEEGNGKSTILKIIAGENPDYVTYSGEIITDMKIALMPQSIEADDLAKDTLSYISEDIDYNQFYSLMSTIAVPEGIFDERIVSSLSGGEKVKLMLMKALYEQPDLLLLDEPTNDLDLKTLIWLEEFIRNTTLPLIFISHDETLLENCAESILHLEQLKRKSEAHMTYSNTTYREYLKYRSDLIDRNNMIAAKQRQELARQLEHYRQIYQKVDHQQKTISRQDPHGGQLLKKKMHALKSQERNLDRKKDQLKEKYEPEEAIRIFFDEININPDKIILDLQLPQLKNKDKILAEDLKLLIKGRDKVCIIGDNGSGKTTLLKRIREELSDRKDLSLAYIPQDYHEVLDYEKDAISFLWDGAYKDDLSKVRSYLGALRFTSEEMSHPLKELSQGQRCKILLLKMILDKADVLLLDEPTRNLSPLSGPVVRKMLSDFGGCIIAVSHDRKFIDEVANQVYQLDSSGLKHLD